MIGGYLHKNICFFVICLMGLFRESCNILPVEFFRRNIFSSTSTKRMSLSVRKAEEASVLRCSSSPTASGQKAEESASSTQNWKTSLGRLFKTSNPMTFENCPVRKWLTKNRVEIREECVAADEALFVYVRCLFVHCVFEFESIWWIGKQIYYGGTRIEH